MSDKRKGTDLFIVDNSDSEWKVRDYLHDWAYLAHTFDVATGYFEIGALLPMDGQWQKLDHIRILMGMRSPSDPRALLAGTRLLPCTGRLSISTTAASVRPCMTP